MGKGKLYPRITAFLVVVGLVFASMAGAYVIHGIKPGKPGGPPTKPKKGNKTTKKGATALGDKIAGFTGSELAKIGKFTITVKFPSGGVVSAKITSAGKTLASGTSSKASKGNKKLTVTFNKAGKKFLNSTNGQSIQLTIHFSFNPNKGKTQTSTTTVRLDR
jgi:hypothetical protein